jgi:hypothetical protein
MCPFGTRPADGSARQAHGGPQACGGGITGSGSVAGSSRISGCCGQAGRISRRIAITGSFTVPGRTGCSGSTPERAGRWRGGLEAGRHPKDGRYAHHGEDR